MICPKPTGMQVMAAGMTEEETETIADIYGRRDVFDDIDQQVMMISTQEPTMKNVEGSIGQDSQETGQYYIGNTDNPEYYEEELIFEDTSEPFNCFSINFVDDTLEIDTIGLYTGVQETSVNNHFTEEIMVEEDRNRSKGIMGELKLDATKPTEQKSQEDP